MPFLAEPNEPGEERCFFVWSPYMGTLAGPISFSFYPEKVGRVRVLAALIAIR